MKGLVLSGGGVKGAYEVGAYLAMKKCHLKFDGIVGTSIGSFNAAMIVAGREKELLKIWKDAEVGKILGFDPEYIKASNTKKDLNFYKMTIKRVGKIVSSKGVPTDGMKKVLEDNNLDSLIRKSKMDFGLSTFRINDFKPLDLFKEDIPEGRINEYILASCYFPIFKFEKMSDDKYYFDGGIYNNCPVNMLIKKGYRKIYAVDLRAIGLKEKVKEKDEKKIIYIKPTHPLCATFTLNKRRIHETLKLGYYDTLKVLNKMDGRKYIFKHKSKLFYLYVSRNVPPQMIDTVKLVNGCNTLKDAVLASLEYMMDSEGMDYLETYEIERMIRRFRHNKYKSIHARFCQYLKL